MKPQETMTEFLALKAPKGWKKRLKSYCERNGCNMSVAIRRAVDLMLEKDPIINQLNRIEEKINRLEEK